MSRRLCRLHLCLLLITASLASCHGSSATARKEFDLTLRGGALPADQQTIRVGQGDDVVLRWSASEPATLHLHGYDVEQQVRPGTVGTMWFVATATGRFPIARHHDGDETTIAWLEVHPR